MKYIFGAGVLLIGLGLYVQATTDRLPHAYPFETIGNALDCGEIKYPVAPFLLDGCKLK
jgi:hypothetical protein